MSESAAKIPKVCPHPHRGAVSGDVLAGVARIAPGALHGVFVGHPVHAVLPGLDLTRSDEGSKPHQSHA